jgi:hypothetical protein
MARTTKQIQRTSLIRGKAKDIDDPKELYARIGYRYYLERKNGPSVFRQSYMESECRRVAELRGDALQPRKG